MFREIRTAERITEEDERKVDQFTGSLIALGNVLYQIEVSEENEIQS